MTMFRLAKCRDCKRQIFIKDDDKVALCKDCMKHLLRSVFGSQYDEDWTA